MIPIFAMRDNLAYMVQIMVASIYSEFECHRHSPQQPQRYIIRFETNLIPSFKPEFGLGTTLI
jgi:hypothetical protein